MVKIINGEKGDGKTKELIKLANETEAKGIKVYVDKDSSNLYNLNRDVKYVDIDYYDVKSALGVISFVKGMIAANPDIEIVYLDGLFDICNEDHSAIIKFFDMIGKYSEKFNIDFVLTISLSDDELPDFIKKYKEQH